MKYNVGSMLAVLGVATVYNVACIAGGILLADKIREKKAEKNMLDEAYASVQDILKDAEEEDDEK